MDQSLKSDLRCRYGGGKIFSGKDRVLSKISKWHLYQPLMIAEPNEKNFENVMNKNHFRTKAFKSNSSKYKFLILYCMFFTFIFGLLSVFNSNEKILNIFCISFVLTLYFLIEYYIGMRNELLLKNRALFINKVFLNRNTLFKFYALGMILIGIIQASIVYTHDYEYLIITYGGYFPAIDSSEYWRLFSAPFFHSGIPHWVANASLLFIIISIYQNIVNSNGILIFLLGCLAGSVASYFAYVLNYSNFNAYAGISGGIYSLLGYMLVYSFFNKNKFPKYLALSIFNFIFLNFILSFLLIIKTSNSAHISGILLGIVCAFVIHISKK